MTMYNFFFMTIQLVSHGPLYQTPSKNKIVQNKIVRDNIVDLMFMTLSSTYASSFNN